MRPSPRRGCYPLLMDIAVPADRESKHTYYSLFVEAPPALEPGRVRHPVSKFPVLSRSLTHVLQIGNCRLRRGGSVRKMIHHETGPLTDGTYRMKARVLRATGLIALVGACWVILLFQTAAASAGIPEAMSTGRGDVADRAALKRFRV
jgi:hypothetical protein